MEYPTIQELKNAITDSIYQNDAGLVTAEIVQERMIDIIETLDAIGGGGSSLDDVKTFLESANDLAQLYIGDGKAATEGWVEAKGYVTAVHNHQNLLSDSITEFTTANGVAIEGVVLKDNSIYIPSTSPVGGIVYYNNDRFLHTYGVNNFFLGKNAGNFTSSSVVGGNTGIGDSVMYALTSGYQNTGIGKYALYNITSGANNFGIGSYALYSVTTTGSNLAIGTTAGQYVTGEGNCFLGSGSGRFNRGGHNVGIGEAAISGVSTSNYATGNYNIGVGYAVLSILSSGERNIAIGWRSMEGTTTGSHNTAIGFRSGDAVTTATNSIFLGNMSGYYETGTKKLIIDSLDRGTEALGRSSALIYGEFNAEPANQTLNLGGGGKVGVNITPVNSMLQTKSTITSISGIFGEATVTAAGGIGIGVDAESNGVNTGSNYGLYAAAGNAAHNYGVYIEANWPPAGDDNYAIYSASVAKSFFAGNIIADADVQNPDFTSGFGGAKWQITEAGNAEFNNMRIRGGLQVYEMIINRLHYQNGNLNIGPGAGKVRSISSATQGAEQMYFETPEGQAMVPFSAGAIIMIHHVDIDRETAIKSIVRQVSAVQEDGRVDMTTTAGWAIGNDVGIFEVGDEACTIGHTSDTDLQNSIYLSAIDSGNPFMRIYAGVSSYAKWNLSDKTTIKLQLGNLASLASYDILPASPGYGLYCDNVYLKGTIVASAGEIGGFTIDETEGIYAGAAETRVQMKPGAGIWAGATAIGDALFSVTNAGALKSVSGTIGGWSIDTDALYTGTKKTSDGYSTNGITIASNGSIHSKKFYINSNGDTVLAGLEIPHLFKKEASDNARNSHTAEISTTNSDYTKVKTITLTNGLLGVVRIGFEIKLTGSNGSTAFGRIYRNGVALGTEQSNNTSGYVYKSEDITQTWDPGDTCELWIKTNDELEQDEAYVKNFILYYDNDDFITVPSTNS